MYYVIPGEDDILMASSPDGLNFSDPQTVLRKGGPYDLYGAVDPAVVKVSDSEFRMYYVGWREKQEFGVRTNNYLMFATSPDGLNWTKVDTVISHEGLSDVTVVPVGGNYRIYYSDKDDLFTILVASDGTTIIDPEKKVELPYGCTVPHILDTGNGYYRLYYNRSPKYDPDPTTKYALRSATSTDLIQFTPEEGIRYENADAPCVIKLPDGGYRLYYQIGSD